MAARRSTRKPKVTEEFHPVREERGPTSVAPEKESPEDPEEDEHHFSGITQLANSGDVPRYLVEWEGRDLFVAFPCYKTTNPATAWSLLAVALDLGREKVRFDMELGDAMIYHARNRLVKKFLATDAKWCLFLDDDMIPPIGRPEFFKAMGRLPSQYPTDSASRHFVHRLVSHGKTLVGASYYGRQPNGPLMSNLRLDSRANLAAEQHSDKVVECEWVGTGCLLVHRSVFLDIQEKFPELATKHDDGAFGFFQPMDPDTGEDVSFCRRAKEAGHAAHLDLGLHCLHVGYAAYGAQTGR